MARNIEVPGDDPGTGSPGDPGYTPPGTGTGRVMWAVVQKSAYTFTEDQIREFGGPWATIIFRVTPLNDNGVGPSAEIEHTFEGSVDVDYDGGDAGTEV